MSDFSSMPLATGYFAPARFDADVRDCEVVGEIPKSLNGAFYRMHADWMYPPKFVDEASLSADGYMSLLRIRDGIVDYKGRYVRTERYKQQDAARRQLYGYYRNAFTDDPSVRNVENPGLRTSANTTPMVLGRQLYATKEDGLPHRLDPNTLETLGPVDFGGRWKSQAFTAHPKVDPRTGETIALGYEASGPATRDVFLATFDRRGEITHEMRFEVPFATLLHDMAITDRHVVLPGGSAVTSLERLKQGRIHYGWDRGVGSFYGIIPRQGSARDIRWFRGPNASLVHTANAWSEGDKVYLDQPMADGNTWPWFPDTHGAPFYMAPFTMRRLTFDLGASSDQYTEELLFSQEISSFTRIDDRFLGQAHRYVYVQYADLSKPFDAALPNSPRFQPVNTVGRFDLKARSVLNYFVGNQHVLQEPVFVPRRDDSPEGEGYLLVTAHNLGAMRAELLVLDALTMKELARIILPFRNAAQVHGTWVDARELPLT